MPVNRFFIDSSFISPLSLQEPEELHHLHVLRNQVGDEVELVNGRGELAFAKILSLSKSEALFEIEKIEKEEKSKVLLHLVIPFLKKSKLELIFEKGTELGVSSFSLYPADGAEKEMKNQNLERFLSLIKSAMKQCGRLTLPPLLKLSSLDACGTLQN